MDKSKIRLKYPKFIDELRVFRVWKLFYLYGHISTTVIIISTATIIVIVTVEKLPILIFLLLRELEVEVEIINLTKSTIWNKYD